MVSVNEFGGSRIAISSGTQDPITVFGQSASYYDNSTERISILDTGLVGIGTATPTSNLTVGGNINATNDICVAGVNCIKNLSKTLYNYTTASGWNDIGTDVILVTSTDQVGIGVALPTSALNVSGSVGIAGNLNISNTLNVFGGANITGGLNVTNGLNVLTGNVGIGIGKNPTNTFVNIYHPKDITNFGAGTITAVNISLITSGGGIPLPNLRGLVVEVYSSDNDVNNFAGIYSASSGLSGGGTGSGYGIYSVSSAGDLESYGIYASGRNVAVGGENYGVYGTAIGVSATNWAGYFAGNLTVTGSNIVLGGDPGSVLTIGTTTSNGVVEIEDAGVCIGTAGCTAPTTQGRLLVAGNIIAGTTTNSYAYNRFGTGAGPSSGQVADANDVYISDDLEVDGDAYISGTGGTAGAYWTVADIAENLHTIESRNNKDICKGNVGCLKNNTKDNLDYGDLVCIDQSVNRSIKKCDKSNSKLAVGFISETFVLNVGSAEGYPIALSGLVVGKAYDFCDKKDCKIAVFVAVS